MAAYTVGREPRLVTFGEEISPGIKKYYNMTPKQNGNASHTLAKQTSDFVSSAYGAYRFAQLPGKVLNVAGEAANLAGSVGTGKSLKVTAKVFNTAAGGMIIPYCAWMAFEVKDQAYKVAEEGAGDGKLLELIRRCFDWVTSACYSLALFIPGVKVFGNIASVTDLTVDSIETHQAATNWTKAHNLLTENKDLSPEIQEDLRSEKTLQFIAGIKSVIAATAGIFAILGFVLSAVIVPPIVALTMGLVTCTLAVLKHFLKENVDSQALSKWKFEEVPAQPLELMPILTYV